MHVLINDVIKPWDELNQRLRRQLAVQPDLSDFTRAAANISVALNHQADHRKGTKKVEAFRSEVHVVSLANRWMCDIADFSKHGSLRNAARNSALWVSSDFEYSPERGFRFIKNTITVEHVTAGKMDFLETSLTAIHYWMGLLDFSLQRPLAVAEAASAFHSKAQIFFDPDFCTNMSQTRFRFFERLSDGTYQPITPPRIEFEVF